MLAVRTLADLDLLEAEVAEEERNLQALKESLEKAEDLTKRMIKTLDAFDDRIAELDPVIIPIFRSVQNMSLIHTNVENTMGLLKLIEGYNQLADTEADLMGRMLSVEFVADFMAALARISNALTEMKAKGLDFCSTTSDRLVQLAHQGTSKLLVAFQEWLQAASQPVDPAHLAEISELPELTAEGLKLISGYALSAENQQIYSQLSSIYIQVRGEFLVKTMDARLSGLQDDIEARTSHPKGSHPYSLILDQIVLLIQAEERFALQVMPSSEAVPKIVKTLADRWLTLTQSMGAKVGKALDRGEYVDQVFVLDLLGHFTTHYNKDRVRLAPLRESLKTLTGMAGVLLGKLRSDMESEGKHGSTAVTPTNATVYEQTSNLLNCLRKIVDSAPVAEALLGRLETGSQETLVIAEDGPLERLAGYCEQNLAWLERAIDLCSKNYKKAMAALIFRLNNYRYLQRTVSTGSLASLVSSSLQEHYQAVVQQLKDQYILAWTQIAGILGPVEGFGASSLASPSMTPKDRAKVFMAELDEAVKLQSGFAMPDTEFRFMLREEAKKVVIDTFESFFAQNQTVFITMAARSGQSYDKDTVNDLLSRILTG